MFVIAREELYQSTFPGMLFHNACRPLSEHVSRDVFHNAGRALSEQPPGALSENEATGFAQAVVSQDIAPE